MTFVLLAVIVTPIPGHSTVDWTPGLLYENSSPPIDTALTPDGKWTFVLTKDSKVRIYNFDGTLNDTIAVTPDIDNIAVNATGEKLIISSKLTNRVQQINISFVASFNNDTAPSLGTPEAPVEIVIFSDFQCPYCAKVGSLLEYALEQNPDTVRIIFKNFPLPFHENARAAAIAALAAQNQGKFWEMHDLLFQNHEDLGPDKIKDLAKEAELDTKRFDADMQNALLNQRVDMDIIEGQKNGVHGTPSIYVNGRSLRDRSPQGLQELINQELARIKKTAK